MEAEAQVTAELEKMGRAEFRRQLDAAKVHPLFNTYCKKQLEDLGLDESDWSFGEEEEFLDMVGWLQWVRVVEDILSKQAAATKKAEDCKAGDEGVAANAVESKEKEPQESLIQSARPLRRELFRGEEDERWDYGHSQKDYYGSQGEGWWGPSAWNHPSWGWARRECYSHPYWSSHLSKWSHPHESDDISTLGSEASPRHEEVRMGILNRKSTENLSELAVGETPKKEEEDDSWRRNKKGELLNPKALYMKFYREIRSNMAALRYKKVLTTSHRVICFINTSP